MSPAALPVAKKTQAISQVPTPSVIPVSGLAPVSSATVVFEVTPVASAVFSLNVSALSALMAVLSVVPQVPEVPMSPGVGRLSVRPTCQRLPTRARYACLRFSSRTVDRATVRISRPSMKIRVLTSGAATFTVGGAVRDDAPPDSAAFQPTEALLLAGLRRIAFLLPLAGI